MSDGKMFERLVRHSFTASGAYTYRLPDQVSGYIGSTNPCDFFVYKKPYFVGVECKSHLGNTLPLSCITSGQMEGMTKLSEHNGIIAGVVVWFIDKDVTYFVPIQMINFLKSKGYKSINCNQIQTWKDTDDDWGMYFIPIDGKKKRKYFEYDFKPFITKLPCIDFLLHGVNLE